PLLLLLTCPLPSSTFFPYTTLFRSLMVRALATGDVRMQDWTRMLGKEFLVALLLGISMALAVSVIGVVRAGYEIAFVVSLTMVIDRKSTRLNSSHVSISYAVFCLKK